MVQFLRFFAPLGLLACSACASLPDTSAVAPVGAVSSADPRASAAGEEVLLAGGSATDAAIATMLALTVVEPQSSGIGGGGFMVRADFAGRVTTLDGRETAPVAANEEWFLDDAGEPLGYREAVLSGLSVGVPGNIALAAEAHERHGKLDWDEVFAPAIRIAREGFLVNRRLHDYLTRYPERAAADPVAQAVFFDGEGNPHPVGYRITNPQLANTLERIAERGPETFYQGDHAVALAAEIWSATPGSKGMTASDIGSYTARERRAVCGTYRGYRVCGMGPPSSGGVAVLQMLGQLERFDLAALGPDSPQLWHLFLESQRLAYADRELYLGDSDFVYVPVGGLLDTEYIATRSALIDPDSALETVAPGTPPSPRPVAWADGDEPPENGTSHFSVADARGNVISYTSTIEGPFGSGLFFGGFYLNNELTDFSFRPRIDGAPVANRVQPAKRPRSSMAPTIVFAPSGEPVLVIGAAGGGTIPVQVARAIMGVIDLGLPAEEALGLPVLMDFRGRVAVEKGSPLEAMIPDLKALGHGEVIAVSPPLKGHALQLVDGEWMVAGDPRLTPQLATE